MDSKAVGFCAIVAVLGITSAVLGFAAEATKLTVSDNYSEGTCVYESSPAFTLGIISVVFAIITQIYINAAFGLCSCCRSNPNSTPISKLCSVLSWVATVFAVILLLAASFLNTDESVATCEVVVKPGIFAAGAILALCSSIFGIVAYVTTTPTTQTTTNPAVAIPMGVKIDPENNPQQYPLQQYPSQQNPLQQYPPQQNPLQQYTPVQQNTRKKQYPQEQP